MDLARHPEVLDRVAAAYALGTLRGGARRRFEAMARQSPTVRAAALLWQERLTVITELQPAQAPGPNVWKRIENIVAAGREVPPATQRLPNPWKAFALGGALATLVAVFVAVKTSGEVGARQAEIAELRQQGTQLVQRNAQLTAQLQAQPEIRYVAVLADDKQAASMLALFDPKHNTLTLKRVGEFQEAADKSLQLWALTEAGPRSMGVLGTEAVMRLGAVEQQLRQSPALAVSLEPKGGVPGEGGPTGPVLFKGAVLQTPL